MIIGAIIACEVGFWVAILSGLYLRYLLNKPRLGAVFLIAAPIIDVILLSLVAADLMSGATASWHHGLAALYIGISVAYGRRMIAWADAKFAEKFKGADPVPVPVGKAYALACWKDVLRTAIAAGITAAIVGGFVLLIHDAARTKELVAVLPIIGLILVIDFIWAVSYTVWPKK